MVSWEELLQYSLVLISLVSLMIQMILPKFKKANRPNANAEPAGEAKTKEGGEDA